MKKLNKNLLLDIGSGLLFSFSLLMSIFIYARLDTAGTFINGIFDSNVNFEGFNSSIDGFFNKLFTFSFGKKDQEVNAKVDYLEVEDHTFKTDDQTVRMLRGGVISYIVKEDDRSFSLVVNYQKYDATYFGLTSIRVKPLDHLLGGEIIGEFEKTFIARFRKDGKEVAFKELPV